MNLWTLQGTPAQRAIAAAGLARCDFPWNLLHPGLRAAVGRDTIPVEWADLSRWATRLAEAKQAGEHLHVQEGDDTAAPVERRDRVLGLFWYSGRIALDISLEANPELAAEVLLSEVAHAVDMFYMTPAMRYLVWQSVHQGAQSEMHDREHGWFELPFVYWTGEMA